MRLAQRPPGEKKVKEQYRGAVLLGPSRRRLFDTLGVCQPLPCSTTRFSFRWSRVRYCTRSQALIPSPSLSVGTLQGYRYGDGRLENCPTFRCAFLPRPTSCASLVR
ncbi:unnamed protein product [Ectocarpus sp. 4 AP-2014]